jgi:hypothetical protein
MLSQSDNSTTDSPPAAVRLFDQCVEQAIDWSERAGYWGGIAGAAVGLVAAAIGAYIRGSFTAAYVVAVFAFVILPLGGALLGGIAGVVFGGLAGFFARLASGRRPRH